ncbi:endo-1,4-beta-xylanase [Lachnoclostridium phytofermentans]|uniref:endo-1,4-beta-xylanase n=1 Tax=Lachnoclostridium phytofermentans TaxID=66219 RepID=UPI000310DA0E|nr:endo-1,4-beta-xylanase [Lachnoclostridium phytofermentans]
MKRTVFFISKFERNKATNITSVTVWGLSDEYSWLNGDKKNPLFFDDNLLPKAAFYGACLDESIPLY